ncbi:hypothetical protein WS70_18680 [Burkholderia mayonis]|uniref:Uncharacterized protein n=1 Tax=Burkholderia mayonis TaxID=1385591 RepID=A0A1B4FJR9_9BURK|nr:hypothetical protein WS70_18680 [Burkholderia mayonis]KVE40568.1 hypothetical protein WS70_17360 [Burkholderia mayonis]
MMNELLFTHDYLIQRDRMVIIGFLVCQLLVNADRHRQIIIDTLIYKEFIRSSKRLSKISPFAKCSDRSL